MYSRFLGRPVEQVSKRHGSRLGQKCRHEINDFLRTIASELLEPIGRIVGEDEEFLGKIGIVVHGGNKSWEETGDFASDYSDSLMLGCWTKRELCREIGCFSPMRELIGLHARTELVQLSPLMGDFRPNGGRLFHSERLCRSVN